MKEKKSTENTKGKLAVIPVIIDTILFQWNSRMRMEHRRNDRVSKKIGEMIVLILIKLTNQWLCGVETIVFSMICFFTLACKTFMSIVILYTRLLLMPPLIELAVYWRSGSRVCVTLFCILVFLEFYPFSIINHRLPNIYNRNVQVKPRTAFVVSVLASSETSASMVIWQHWDFSKL